MLVTNRKKLRVKRAIALFLLFTLLNQIAAPGIAYALTAGPTSPEATSFEPVDMTDMVNPLTGNFTYGIPLLEVPGPEGSYPLSLSYHAGIQPNEEASWVGLGWSLNPGSIARNVSGFPDDFSDVQQSNRSYWAGGSRSTFGITVGLPIGVTFGLSFAEDTYQGFGVGGSIGYGYNIPGTPLGIGGQIGVGPYGGMYAGVDLSITTGEPGKAGLALGGNIGLSTNFKSISADAGAGVSYSDGHKHGLSMSLMGASMSSNGTKPSLSVGGGSISVYNSNAGKIQTSSTGFSFGLPPIFGVSIGLSYNYERYWSDETATIYTNGSLYFPQSITDQSYFNSRTYDIYRLLDPKNYNIVDYNDPDHLQGGTFPDFDNYSVTAQGLGGSIRPYIYQSSLYSQNQTSANMVETSGAPVNGLVTVPGIQFRFINDFSNAYRQSPLNMPGLQFQFDSPKNGNNDGNYGYNTSNNQLEGSKHIVWFTNNDINSSVAKLNGFIDTKAAGFTRMGNAGAITNTKGGAQIGGFMITNESGVTYHYALPAYEKNDYTYTATQDDSKSTTDTKTEPYAYTWYLTAITGPDYYDANGDGLADSGDWGYWVNFDYGKWSDSYNWRNPAQGAHTEVDPNYKSYSSGTKEVYYLDAIETRSHTAIFEKEIRADGKSLLTTGNGSNSFLLQQSGICDNSGQGCNPAYYYPVPTLALKDIMLFKNEQLTIPISSLRNYSACCGGYNGIYTFSAQTSNTDGSHNAEQVIAFHAENVIDTYDMQYTGLENKCLRRIAFNYDYSLSPGVPNSYDPGGTIYSATPNTGVFQNLGRLTLLSVDQQGTGGTPVTPPIQFQYDLDPTDPANQDNIDITSVPSNLQGTIYTHTYNKFKAGDIISFTISGTLYYCTLLSTTDYNNFNVLYLNAAPTATTTNLAALHTKNPPYNKDAYDIWQMYKSDYIPISNNENLSRITSQISNKNVDAWSLRKIQSSLGANFCINYEGDTYQKSVLNKNKSMVFNGGSFNSTANTVTIPVSNPQGQDLTKIYVVGSTIDAEFLFSRQVNYSYHGSTIHGADKKVIALTNYKPSYIQSLSGNNVTISVDPQFFSTLAYASGYYQGNPNYPITGAVPLTILTGNAQPSVNATNSGGGVRVRDLIVDDLSGIKRKTSYNYNMLDPSPNPRVSSGVTSYEPVALDNDNIYSYLSSANTADTANISAYHRVLYTDINNVITLSRAAPGPGVMYEYMTIADSNIMANGTIVPSEGQTTYQFRVFNTGMIGLSQYQNSQTSTLYLKNVSVKDYTSQIGNLVRSIQYDVNGNKIAETRNHYLNDDIIDDSYDYMAANYEQRLAAYNYQGFIQERYADGRSFGNNGNWRYELTMSGHDEIPIIQTGSTKIDYKNGTTVNQTQIAFDFYSGSITETLTTDSYGNRFMTQVTPAYRQYPAMGLKVSSINNANMLTQVASTYTYSVNSSNTPIGVVAATVQTWSNAVPVLDPNGAATTTAQSNIWRMEKDYQWLPSGTSANNVTPYASFIDYYASGGSTNASWKKTSQVSQYNVYSAALEGSDFNGNYAATRMGYNNTKVIAAGGVARYNEIAYAGAEDPLLSNGNFSSQVSPGGGTVVTDTTKAHTGTNSLMVPVSAKGFTYTVPLTSLSPVRQNYSVSVWVKPAPSGSVSQATLYYSVNGGATVTPVQTLAKTAAGWYLLEMTVPSSALVGTTGNLVVGCQNGPLNALYFDDFRFQPTASLITAYVYDNATGQLSYVLDNNDLFTRYQYDAIGRLIRTYKEVLGKTTIPLVSATNYNYARGN